jgi:hypothetical protein
MTSMAKTADAGAGLRRARAAAWTVFLSMAGTTMTFQVFHSIRFGGMPWPLAVLYGVVPLLISICILEVVAEWTGAPWWARLAAYLIMGGSMFLSAAATGDVVLHAAPAHWSLLFGFLLDAAALLTVHFILAGPTAAAAAAALARREAELRAETATVQAALEAAGRDREAVRADANAALEALRAEVTEAVVRAETATARADALAEKLARSSGRNKTRKPAPKSAASSGRNKTPETTAGSSPEMTVPEDVDTQAEALRILAAEPGISGSELGRRLGKTERYGCMLKKSLAASAPDPGSP